MLNLMQGERWSLAGDLDAGRYTSAAVRVVHRVLSFVPDLPAQVLAARPAGRDPYWDLEGTELLLTVLAVLLILLRPGAPEPAGRVAGDAAARRWVEALVRRARGEGAERGPNLVALAAWAMPPWRAISAATNPMRRRFTVRCSREKPSSVERTLRTASPSRTVTRRHALSRSIAASALASVDLPAPESPVSSTAKPWRCRGGQARLRSRLGASRARWRASARCSGSR